MEKAVIRFEGMTYLVDRIAFIEWLRSHAEVFQDNPPISEFRKVDDEGRTLLNG